MSETTNADDGSTDELTVKYGDGISAPEEVVSLAHDLGADVLETGRAESGRYSFKFRNVALLSGTDIRKRDDMKLGTVMPAYSGDGMDVTVRMEPEGDTPY